MPRREAGWLLLKEAADERVPYADGFGCPAGSHVSELVLDRLHVDRLHVGYEA